MQYLLDFLIEHETSIQIKTTKHARSKRNGAAEAAR